VVYSIRLTYLRANNNIVIAVVVYSIRLTHLSAIFVLFQYIKTRPRLRGWVLLAKVSLWVFGKLPTGMLFLIVSAAHANYSLNFKWDVEKWDDTTVMYMVGKFCWMFYMGYFCNRHKMVCACSIVIIMIIINMLYLPLQQNSLTHRRALLVLTDRIITQTLPKRYTGVTQMLCKRYTNVVQTLHKRYTPVCNE
jgi:hypothetical protein